MFSEMIRDYFRDFGTSSRGIAAVLDPSGLQSNTILCSAAEVGLAVESAGAVSPEDGGNRVQHDLEIVAE